MLGERTVLYHLAKDESEKHDLAREMPEKTRELKAALDGYLKSVSARIPTLNPFKPDDWAGGPARGER